MKCTKKKILIALIRISIFRFNASCQSTFPCNGINLASSSSNKEYYDLLFSKSFFLNIYAEDVPYNLYAWNHKGNTYKLPPATTPTKAMGEAGFNSLENGARLIESLLVMYETTHDKAYLHWATDLSVHWISFYIIQRVKKGKRVT
jgi:hypothetical protein